MDGVTIYCRRNRETFCLDGIRRKTFNHFSAPKPEEYVNIFPVFGAEKYASRKVSVPHLST